MLLSQFESEADMAKKTIQVAELKEVINRRLADKTLGKEAKQELASLIRYVLHRTGNYQGFNYVDWMEGGSTAWERDGRPEDNTPYLGDPDKIFFF